jgi:hypothetical protein
MHNESDQQPSGVAWDLQIIAQRITTLADLAVDLHAEALQTSQAANLYREVALSSARVSHMNNRLPPSQPARPGAWRPRKH